MDIFEEQPGLGLLDIPFVSGILSFFTFVACGLVQELVSNFFDTVLLLEDDKPLLLYGEFSVLERIVSSVDPSQQ